MENAPPANIKHHQRAETTPDARDHEFERIINAIPALAWSARPDGFAEFFNQQYLAYVGLPLEQLQGSGWTGAVHPDDRKKLVEEWQSCLASGGAVDTEARIRRFDGSYRWFLIRACPLRDDSENIIKWYGTNLLMPAGAGTSAGVEAHGSADAPLDPLTLQKAFFERVLARVPEAIVLLGTDDRILQVNPEFTRVFGYSQEEACGRLINELLVPEELLAEAEEYSRLGLRGVSVDIETVRKHKDGARIHVSIVSGPVSIEGSQAAEYVIYRDITERNRADHILRESEAKLRQVIDTIPTLAWCNLAEGPNEFLSKRWHEYTGLSPEESHGWGWQVAFHPDDLPHLMERWKELLISGEPGEIEARLRRHDGVYRWFLIRVEPFRGDTGKIVRWYGTSTDIEDRKRAEEALQASERELRSIISAIPTLAWSAAPDGSADFLNERWLNYAGMTAEQAANWGWAEVIHPEDRPGLVAYWQSCLASGTPVETEARMRRFDGAYRWFLFRANPVRDSSGKIVRWYGTNIDIEDRKRREEALHVSELSWRQIVDSIPGLVATTGAMGEVEFLNRQTLEYFGNTTEELKNWAMIDAVHPDDLPHVIEVRKKSIVEGQIYDVEHRCRRADGVYRWFQVRGLPVRDAENQIIAWYLLLTDIDDRKKAEQALQSNERNLSLIINTMPTLVWSTPPDGSLDFVNQRWLDYTGLSLQQALGWGWTGAIHPEDLNRLADYWQSILGTGEPGEIEARFRRFDGEYRWFLFRANALRDESGKIVRWYGTNTDIEDRKQAEEALRQSEERARSIVDSIDALVMTATPEGGVEFANQQVFDYFGKSFEELKSWATSDAIHPDDLPRVVPLWAHSVETGDPYQFEQRLRRSDGAYRWFRVSGRSLRDTQGHIARWYVLLTDIDEGKRAEAQVEQAYLRLTEAQRLSKTGSFITDLLADNHNWSEEAFRIFEFDPAAKVTAQRVRDVIHPEDQPTFEAVIARAMTGVDVDFAFRIVTPQGIVKHLRGMARVMGQSAGHPLFIGALQDVTESKLAEEALNRARSELAHVARVTTLNVFTASIAHEVNQPLSGILTNASTSLRMLNGDPPNVDGARETARRTIRDANRASDVITRLRTLFSKREFTLEQLDLNEATQEVIALSLSDLQRNRVILRSELANDLPPVTGDRVQLQQVILNLVRNASDAMVDVDARPRELLIRTQKDEGERVRLSVKDAGVGFTPEAKRKLFEAFYTTKSDGMGIGLSVSRSIIERHDGRLWAEPNEGPGATFSFSIPCGSGSVPRAATE